MTRIFKNGKWVVVRPQPIKYRNRARRTVVDLSGDPPSPSPENVGQINLWVPFYLDPVPERRDEILEALRKNEANTLLKNIFLVSEQDGLDHLGGRAEIIPVKSRPTYNDIFSFIRSTSDGFTLNLIANCDIALDETVWMLWHLYSPSIFFALSRHNKIGKNLIFFDRTDSQDVWGFFGHPRKLDGDFMFGIPGCDNAIAARAAAAGYSVANVGKSVRCTHIHSSEIRNHKEKERIRHPYLLVPTMTVGDMLMGGGFSPTVFNAPLPSLASVASTKQLPRVRVLHFALLVDGSPQLALREALRTISIGKGYLEIDWPHSKDPSAELERAFVEFKPDLTFCQVQAPKVVTPQTFKNRCGVVINWTGDVRSPLPQWYIDIGHFVDWTLFSNQTDVDLARKAGIRSEFMNIGFDNQIYTPDGDVDRSAEIVFMGNNYPRSSFPLSRERASMVALLSKRYGSRFAVFGGNWKGAVNITYDPQRETAIYRGCKVAINQNHFNHDRFSSDRLLRAMGCGAYVVSNHYPNLEKDFIPGKHLGAWKTFEDLFREIDWALEHEEERKAIAAAGCSLVHEKHTWNARMGELLTIAGLAT